MHRSSIGVWIASSHAAVAAALRHPQLGSDERKADPDAIDFGVFNRFLKNGDDGATRQTSPFLEMFSELMLFRDAPDHTRLRALVSKAFTPRRVEALTDRVAEITDEMLTAAARNGGADIMRDVAYPLPARVICELVGVPRSDEPLIVRHAPALAIGLDPSPMRPPASVARADEATKELISYMTGLIATKRREPGDDLLSALIEAEEGGSKLSEAELVATVLLLLLAGHETTANLIGNALLALDRDTAARERLREDASVEKSAVDEFLRFDPPVQMAVRVALDDIEVDGHEIDKGRLIVLVVGAANRDPAVFHEPAELDLGRSPNPHLTFGGGAHFCIGAPLARLEGRIVLPEIYRRFPDLRVRSFERRKSFTIRGLTKLDVKL
jgi:cytochrome P450